MAAANKKLLIFCPLYPPHIGGLESHAEQFNKYMSQRGYDISVFTPLVVAGSPEREIIDGVNIFRFPAFELIPNYHLPRFWTLRFWRQVLAIRKITPDIIITRTRFFFTSLSGLLYSKITGIPSLHIEHGADYVHFRSPLLRWLGWTYDQIIGRLIFLLPDEVVANSQASARFAKQLAPRRNISVIYRGIDIEAINQIEPSLNPALKDPGKIVIAYFGRLIEGKGVHDFIDALNLLKHLPLISLIVGAGPQSEQLRQRAKKIDDIHFLGELPWSENISVLKIADIVINPSYTEGLPTSILEACVCRKAIIATRVGGTKEILPDTEYLISPGDIFTLSQRIETLCRDTSARNSLAKMCQDSVANKFSWPPSLDQYEILINSIRSRA